MKKYILKFLKTLALFLLLFTFSSLIKDIFNINIDILKNKDKYLFLFITDIIFLIILFFSYKDTIIRDFKSFTKNFFTNLEEAFKYWLIGFVIMVVSNLFIVVFSKSGLAENEQNIRTLIDIAPLYMIFSVVIYAPLTEELIFRKGFRDIIKNKYLFILISGLTFGTLHVITYINSYADLVYLIPYCALGLSFSYMYTKTNNIFSSISMHLMHNSFAIILYLLGSVL